VSEDDDYITTQVLPQSVVTAAISGEDVDHSTNAERIAGLDKTMGRVVDTQVGHERRLAALDHQMDLIEKDLRDVERRAGQYAFMVMALLAVLVLIWMR
jgi:hypothetical protein